VAGEEGAERWKADTYYSDVDFDDGPEAAVHVVFRFGLVSNTSMCRGWSERYHSYLQVESLEFASFNAKNRIILVKVTLSRNLSVLGEVSLPFLKEHGTYNPPIPKMKYKSTFSRLSLCNL
jgi:hypothetical protein